MQFETLSKLAESHQMGNKRAIDLLTAAGCLAAAEVPFGKGTMRLYDGDAARAALAAAVKAEGEAAASAALAAMPKVEPTPLASTVIAARISALQAENRKLHADGVGDHERIEAAATKLSDQNVLLRRALDDMKTAFLNRLDALQESFDARIDALAAAPPAVSNTITLRRTDAPKLLAPKPRVAIVGLFPAQITAIEKDFADVFDLVMIPGGDAVTPGHTIKLGTCTHVFVMQHGQSKDGERAIKAAGVHATRINGSLSSLRNELTNLFVSISDKKAV